MLLFLRVLLSCPLLGCRKPSSAFPPHLLRSACEICNIYRHVTAPGIRVPPDRKWYKHHLTYQIVNRPRHLPLSTVRLVVRAAFQLWSNVSNLAFREVAEGPADIRLAFYEGDHNDGTGNAFDGPGRSRNDSVPARLRHCIDICALLTISG